jgi:hypothetical protein
MVDIFGIKKYYIPGIPIKFLFRTFHLTFSHMLEKRRLKYATVLWFFCKAVEPTSQPEGAVGNGILERVLREKVY